MFELLFELWDWVWSWVGVCGWARFGLEHVSIGSEVNLYVAIAHSSLTTNRYSIKTIVVSWISELCTRADLPFCWL